MSLSRKGIVFDFNNIVQNTKIDKNLIFIKKDRILIGTVLLNPVN